MAERVATAEVILRDEVTAEQRQLLSELLEGAGYPATVRRPLSHREPATVTWIALVVLPLQAFLGGLGEVAVGGALRGIRRLVRGDGSADGAPALPGPMVLQDSGSGIKVVLEAGLPPEAFEKLLQLDLSDYRLGPLHYDIAQARWRSVADEALPDEVAQG
ncbi:hypothetical protein [Streptomyces sp. NPDC050738]|uniref:hypothetical protein n=1 Tax=Streptomyces sp. NPDC050738 TaxID=3154744 RepID=UPI003417F722